MDHVIPRDRGGGTSWENVVISCIHCNSKKSNRATKRSNEIVKRAKETISKTFHVFFDE